MNNGRNQRSQAKQVDTLQNVDRNEDEKTSAQERIDRQIVRRASSGSISNKRGESEVRICSILGAKLSRNDLSTQRHFYRLQLHREANPTS
jgi:hypothetical protein